MIVQRRRELAVTNPSFDDDGARPDLDDAVEVLGRKQVPAESATGLNECRVPSGLSDAEAAISSWASATDRGRRMRFAA